MFRSAFSPFWLLRRNGDFPINHAYKTFKYLSLTFDAIEETL